MQLVGDGRPVYLHVAQVALESTERGPDSVGLVVGATDIDAMRRLRQGLPSGVWILAPGIGAQVRRQSHFTLRGVSSVLGRRLGSGRRGWSGPTHGDGHPLPC